MMRSSRPPPAGPLGWATCPAPLRSWVLGSCEKMAAALGSAHLGTYLHGSLASGSYHAPKSDVDLMFVVEDGLAPEVRRRFARAAAGSNGNRPTVGSLECSVVRLATLRARTHPAPVEVRFSEGAAADILHDRVDWHHVETDVDLAAHVQALCEFGIALAGPSTAETFSPFAQGDVLDAIRGDREWILEGENLLGTPYYGILNVARSLWITESGSARLAVSKLEAGLWLTGVVPARLRPVVELALDVYCDAGPVLAGERRTGGRDWPLDDLRAFRDWARTRRFR